MDYKLIRSKRKTLSMQMTEGGLVVRAPFSASEKSISDFLKKHERWIKKREEELERRLAEALAEFGEPYDEVVANDVARFLDLSKRCSQRLGIGRLFSKGMRDARVIEIREGIATPTLSAEALECLSASRANASGVSA